MPSNQRHSREPKIPDRIDTARPTVSFLFQATSRKVSAQLSTKFRSFFFKPIFLISLACVVGLKSQQIIGGTVKQAGHLHENIGRDGRIPSNVGKVRLRGNSQLLGDVLLRKLMSGAFRLNIDSHCTFTSLFKNSSFSKFLFRIIYILECVKHFWK